LWPDLFLYSGLNKHTSNTECCVSYGNDEMPFILQPETQDRKILLEITKEEKNITLLETSKRGT
jgi:hypothetical protein